MWGHDRWGSNTKMGWLLPVLVSFGTRWSAACRQLLPSGSKGPSDRLRCSVSELSWTCLTKVVRLDCHSNASCKGYSQQHRQKLHPAENLL